MSFYLSRNVHDSYDAIMAKLKVLLHAQDYLIAADINVQGALKTKLNADLPRIHIIGTNTPKVGFELFSTDPKLGTLLPFSIVLNELGESDVEVAIVDPEWLFKSVDNPDITALARDIKQVFKGVLDCL